MAYNFLRGDRDQPFLLPPDLRDWLPAGHLAWFIRDVVDQFDLGPFLAAYRADGHGRAAYDPKLLLGVLLYAYAIGVRSSRQIQRRCVEDLAFRVLAGNSTPDHVTIARFRVRHEQALAGFLVASLRLCAAAGMVRLGTVALDGTKVAANAAERANRTHDKLKDEVAEILRQAAEADQHEDREHDEGRGDELPAALASKAGRLARLRQAKALLEAEAAARQRRYEQRVAALAAAARARGKTPKARLKPRARDEAPDPERVANVTDPDSRLVRTRKGSLQGYNAQAVTTCEQVIVAAELTQQATDLQQLGPMLEATAATLGSAGIAERPGTLLADAGYWTIANLTAIPDAPELLIPPARHGRQGKPRKDGRPSASRSDGAARGDDRQAPKRAGQGELRLAEGDRRAGLRPGQGAAGGATVLPPRAACLHRGVEAVVRHPQPAQAVAAPDRRAARHAGHLSLEQPRRGRQGGPPAPPPSEGFPRSARPSAPGSPPL
jgi:transposase